MKVLFFACAIALGLGTVSEFNSNRQPRLVGANDNIGQTTDGAFRDGLYLGRLTAERGSEPHVASARWASEKDRAAFSAGYHRGYNESLASRVVPANRDSQGE